MSKRALTIAGTALVSGLLAACGSSKAPGVQLAPSAGSTAPAPAAAATTTTSTSTTTNVKPPPQLSKKPVVTVPSTPAPKKLVIKDLIKGTGKTATPGSTVTVNYVGVLYKGGKEFDSSWKRNQTFTTPLTRGSVISGWVEAFPG